MRSIFSIIVFLLFSLTGFSQSHLWAEPLSGSIGGAQPAPGIAVDGNHNSFVVIIYGDTLKIQTKTFVSKSERPYYHDLLLAKFNKQGSLTKFNSIYTKSLTIRHRSLFYKDIKLISNNKIMVYGYFNGSRLLMLSPTDSITNNNNQGKGFIAFYDSSLNLTGYRVLYKGMNSDTLNSITNSNQLDVDSKNNLYLNCDIRNGVFYSGKDSVMASYPVAKSIVVKYSPNFDSIVWVKELSDKSTDNFIAMRMQVAKDDNIYLACNLLGGTQTINTKRYVLRTNFVKGFFIVLSPSGKFISSELINKDTTLQESITDIGAVDTNNIYVCGYAFDSIFFGNTWYKSPHKYSPGIAYPYIARVSTQKGAKWIDFANERHYAFAGFKPLELPWDARLNFDKESNVYFSFFNNNVKNGNKTHVVSIGGLKDSSARNGFTGFAKLDSMGNALWVRWIYKGINEIKPDSNNIVFTGFFQDTLKLKPFAIKSYWRTQCGFVAKTYDYAIRRGNISTGPYCAGDTIKVPYTKDGEYDTGNYFIAELSDEFGKFDGKERELGRLKTNKAGVVKGVLPLFQSASSVKYRIRIRSTNPVVQSNYKADGLRLLIYSKDKADSGKPESICYGDSILLNTYGGTKWTWSPNYNMADSTQRQTKAWPAKTTTYKIIIGDSSGCGKPDTAYKLINVRQPLKTVLAFQDTGICGNDLKVPYYFTGGDSLNYKFQWYYISSPKLWFPLKNGKNIVYDTLTYTLTDPLEKLAIVLTDNCTNKPDTAYLTISLKKKVTLKTTFRDTSLCSGHELNYKAILGGTKALNFQWKDLLTNTVLSTRDSLKLKTSKTLKIQLIAHEGCEALGDTALFNVTVKPELKATVNLRDTSLCFGKNVNYTAKANGGNSKAYTYAWLLDGKVVSTADNFALETANRFSPVGETKNLVFILKDNCSFPDDTIQKTINVKPAPKAGFSYDLACHRTITNFKFTGTKPMSPVMTSFLWNLNNEASSNLENPSRLFGTTGTKKITLTVNSNNGCSDIISKDVVVEFQSTADFSAKDVCESDSVVFINTSKDATGYRWRFGDGEISKIQNPKHKYQIVSSTTFNVSMVADASGGCSDSIVKAVTVTENPKSDFTYTNTGGKVDFKAIQSGGISYRWLFGTGDSAKVSTQMYSYTYKNPSLYKVCLKVINTGGCQSETCKDISITLGISSLNKPDGFKIYPNPHGGNFTIEIENPRKDVSIEIVDLLGNILKTIETSPSQTTYSAELDVANGMYVVRVKNGNVAFNRKVSISGK